MKSILKSLLLRLGYRVQCVKRTPKHLLSSANVRALTFDDVVCRCMYERQRPLVFVQIGVYDGITHDPLRKYILSSGWRGVMVEPQRAAVDSLQQLYADNDRIVVLHAALDSSNRARTLFTVDPVNMPEWVGGLASFDRDVIAKHSDLVPGLDAAIREERVPCLPFADVLSHIPHDELDLLQIDTEGADGFILSLFPFDRLRPSIVHFEIKHMSRSQQETAFEILVGNGYHLATSGHEDMIAVLR